MPDKTPTVTDPRRSRTLAALLLGLVWSGLCIAGLVRHGSATPALPEAKAAYRVDINHADAATLQLLPHIGPAIAENIIAYRQVHGPFASVEELEQVNKIGPTIRRRVSPWVTLTSEPVE